MNASETAEVLLKSGADANAKDNKGLTPLHLAAGKNDFAMAEVLLKAGADANAKPIRALRRWTLRRQIMLLRRLRSWIVTLLRPPKFCPKRESMSTPKTMTALRHCTMRRRRMIFQEPRCCSRREPVSTPKAIWALRRCTRRRWGMLLRPLRCCSRREPMSTPKQ